MKRSFVPFSLFLLHRELRNIDSAVLICEKSPDRREYGAGVPAFLLHRKLRKELQK